MCNSSKSTKGVFTSDTTSIIFSSQTKFLIDTEPGNNSSLSGVLVRNGVPVSSNSCAVKKLWGKNKDNEVIKALQRYQLSLTDDNTKLYETLFVLKSCVVFTLFCSELKNALKPDTMGGVDEFFKNKNGIKQFIGELVVLVNHQLKPYGQKVEKMSAEEVLQNVKSLLFMVNNSKMDLTKRYDTVDALLTYLKANLNSYYADEYDTNAGRGNNKIILKEWGTAELLYYAASLYKSGPNDVVISVDEEALNAEKEKRKQKLLDTTRRHLPNNGIFFYILEILGLGIAVVITAITGGLGKDKWTQVLPWMFPFVAGIIGLIIDWIIHTCTVKRSINECDF